MPIGIFHKHNKTMENLKNIISSTTKVRFQDCDPFNHLNNGEYIDYMMNAREDQIQDHYGLNLFELANKDGIGWVVATNQISYIQSATIMEELLLDSQLVGFSSKHLDVEIRMWDKNQTQLKAFMWTKFVHVNIRNQQVGKHPQHLMDLFQAVVLPVKETAFDERNQFLRTNVLSMC